MATDVTSTLLYNYKNMAFYLYRKKKPFTGYPLSFRQYRETRGGRLPPYSSSLLTLQGTSANVKNFEETRITDKLSLKAAVMTTQAFFRGQNS